jgi:hypothetical protein
MSGIEGNVSGKQEPRKCFLTQGFDSESLACAIGRGLHAQGWSGVLENREILD